jgi:hypothetical protein
MTVLKSTARLLGAHDTVVGEGRAYVHLREERTAAQACQGTLALEWWDEAAAAPAALLLDDGTRVPITVQSDRLSGCLAGRILRYQARWPGGGPSAVRE